MEFLLIMLIGAGTFGVCFLVDKVLKRLFRSKPQHKTGLSVRLSQHYSGAGVVLAFLGVMAVFQGWNRSNLLLFCGGFVAVLGLGFIAYYLSFGIYYDEDGFLLTRFGNKSVTYQYGDIQGQKLYQVTGGSVIVELFFHDGKSVSLQSTMTGVYPFLDRAFSGWCRQTGVDPADCPFHDPRNSCWFPSMEE